MKRTGNKLLWTLALWVIAAAVLACGGKSALADEAESHGVITLKKIAAEPDSVGKEVPLNGAEFTLERYAQGVWEPMSTVVTQGDGIARLEVTPGAPHRLTETAPPEGYEKLAEPILFVPESADGFFALYHVDENLEKGPLWTEKDGQGVEAVSDWLKVPNADIPQRGVLTVEKAFAGGSYSSPEDLFVFEIVKLSGDGADGSPYARVTVRAGEGAGAVLLPAGSYAIRPAEVPAAYAFQGFRENDGGFEEYALFSFPREGEGEAWRLAVTAVSRLSFEEREEEIAPESAGGSGGTDSAAQRDRPLLNQTQLVEIPDADVPLTDRPDLAEIPDPDVPLKALPQTGGRMGRVPLALAGLGAAAVLCWRKRRG